MADIKQVRVDNTLYNIKDKDARDRLGTIEPIVSGHTTTLANHNTRITDNHNDINAEIVEREAEIARIDGELEAERTLRSNEDAALRDELTASIEKASDMAMITIGDSYGLGTGPQGEGQYVAWTTLIREKLGLVDRENYWTLSKGGVGFTKMLDNSTFLTLLQRVRSWLTDKQAATIKVVLVAGGYNDKAGTNESDIKAFCNYAKTEFPNARVLIGCVGWSPVSATRVGIFNKACMIYRKCGAYGAGYLANSEYSLHDYTMFTSDNIHPNAAGQENIASMLANGVITGSCSTNYAQVQFAATALDVASYVNCGGFIVLNNETTSFLFNSVCRFTVSGITMNKWYDVAEIPCDLINCIENDNFVHVGATGYIQLTNGKYINAVIDFCIRGKKLKMNIRNVNAEGNSFFDASLIKDIYVVLGSFMAPSFYT